MRIVDKTVQLPFAKTLGVVALLAVVGAGVWQIADNTLWLLPIGYDPYDSWNRTVAVPIKDGVYMCAHGEIYWIPKAGEPCTDVIPRGAAVFVGRSNSGIPSLAPQSFDP